MRDRKHGAARDARPVRLLCPACGYHLTSLDAPFMTCPECGRYCSREEEGPPTLGWRNPRVRGLGPTTLPAVLNLLLLATAGFVRIRPLAQFLTFAFVFVTPLFELAATLVVLSRTSYYSSRVRWWAFLGWTLLLNAAVYVVGGFVVVSIVLSSLADV